MEQSIEQLSQESNGGMLTFPEFLGELMKLKVEAYFADFRKNTTTYYTKQDAAQTVAMPLAEVHITQAFTPTALQAAIYAAQQDEIRYPEFKKRAKAAGCIGYFVWIEGRQVTYFGRRGELHVEKFPDK